MTMSLEIQVEEFKGEMVFAIPYMTIDPIRDKLKTGTQFDVMAVDPQWAQPAFLRIARGAAGTDGRTGRILYYPGRSGESATR